MLAIIKKMKFFVFLGLAKCKCIVIRKAKSTAKANNSLILKNNNTVVKINFYIFRPTLVTMVSVKNEMKLFLNTPKQTVNDYIHKYQVKRRY